MANLDSSIEEDSDDDNNLNSNSVSSFIDSKYILQKDLCDFFKQSKHAHNGQFNLLHINCRSLKANYSSILNLLDNSRMTYSAIALTETWLNETNDDIFQIEGYTFISRNRKGSKSGGGVGLYVNDCFDVNVRNDLSTSNEVLECVFVEVRQKLKHRTFKALLGVIYRPPNCNVLKFNAEMDKIMTIIDKKKHKISIIAGDINIDLIKSATHTPTNDFVNLLASHSFLPSVNKPTRVTNTTATLIDNIFINNMSLDNNSVILYNDISDHFPIALCIKVPVVNVTKPIHRNTRTYTPQSTRCFLDALQNIDWHTFTVEHCNTDDVDYSYNKFHELYSTAYKKSFPLESKKVYSRRNPRQEWISSGLIKSCNTKSKLYKKCKVKPTPENIAKYKIYRNKLKHLIRVAEEKFYTDKIKRCSGNLKQIWTVLGTLVNPPNSKSFIFDSEENGQQISDPKTIVKKFKAFFYNYWFKFVLKNTFIIN